MVIVGGLTRLTNSGLSMVEWNLFMGSVPPTSQADWQLLFEKYKQYPEYKQVNFNIGLEEFKNIFYWEYFHRILGRLIGLVFIIPFIWFLIKKRIARNLLPKLLFILFLGGFQGFLGWYMVKSGLVKNPDVSHYRLAMHLVTAFITFAYTLWVALGLINSGREYDNSVTYVAIRRLLKVLLIVLFIQIIWGAYVAGLNAGKVYNTWPKMGSEWIASSVTAMKPWWLNFIEGIAGVQFLHRYIAYLVLGLVIFIYLKAKNELLSDSQSMGLKAMVITVIIQLLLGIITLVYAVPVVLGVLHQLGAFILLGTVVYNIYQFNHSLNSQSI